MTVKQSKSSLLHCTCMTLDNEKNSSHLSSRERTWFEYDTRSSSSRYPFKRPADASEDNPRIPINTPLEEDAEPLLRQSKGFHQGTAPLASSEANNYRCSTGQHSKRIIPLFPLFIAPSRSWLRQRLLNLDHGTSTWFFSNTPFYAFPTCLHNQVFTRTCHSHQ